MFSVNAVLLVKHSVGEPVVDMFATNEADGQIPVYAWEDVRIGLDQYERGEYMNVNVHQCVVTSESLFS